VATAMQESREDRFLEAGFFHDVPRGAAAGATAGTVT
jgi:hypothetical protein